MALNWELRPPSLLSEILNSESTRLAVLGETRVTLTRTYGVISLK
jgi:hypothetical protein